MGKHVYIKRSREKKKGGKSDIIWNESSRKKGRTIIAGANKKEEIQTSRKPRGRKTPAVERKKKGDVPAEGDNHKPKKEKKRGEKIDMSTVLGGRKKRKKRHGPAVVREKKKKEIWLNV